MHRGLEPKFESMDRSEGEAQPLLNKAGIRASGMAGKKFSTFRNHEQLEPDYSDGRVKRRARPSPFPEQSELPTSKPKRRHRGGVYNDTDISCKDAAILLGKYLGAMTVLFTTVFVVFFFVHDLAFKYNPWVKARGQG